MKVVNMKVVVIGGTGLIGSKVVANLTELGHQAVAASPSSGVDTLTGEAWPRCSQAPRSSSTSPTRRPSTTAPVLNFFTTSTRNLLAAEHAAGVGATRRAVGRRRRRQPQQWLPPGQDRPGDADRGIGRPVHHRAGDAVLRVRRPDRRIRDGWKRRAVAARLDAADRRARRRRRGHRCGDRASRQRDHRDRRTREDRDGRLHPHGPGRAGRPTTGRRRPTRPVLRRSDRRQQHRPRRRRHDLRHPVRRLARRPT